MSVQAIEEVPFFACNGGSIQARDAAGAPLGEPFVTESITGMAVATSFEEKTNLSGTGRVMDSARTDSNREVTVNLNRFPVKALPVLEGHVVTYDSTTGDATVEMRAGDRGAAYIEVQGISGTAKGGRGVLVAVPFGSLTSSLPVNLGSQEFVDFSFTMRAEQDPDEDRDIADVVVKTYSVAPARADLPISLSA